ncbi:uncharacterized protein ACJ7VT_017002 [Polymixia lowei]
MSAPDVNFQAQVESVLGELVKVATVELTKLFETRYQASTRAVVKAEGRNDQNETLETLQCFKKSDGKLLRSIGVQVNENIYAPSDLSAPQYHSDGNGDCLNECRKEDSTATDKPVKDNDLVDQRCPPPKATDVAMVDGSTLETESPTTSCPEAEVVNHDQRPGSSQSSPPLLVQPEKESDITAGSQVKFVCPLVLKTELQAPEPERLEEPVQVEPQQANVSTAEGTAYSPSPSDGAVAPLQVRVWERICAVKEAGSHLQLKLRLSSQDQKLMRPCSVQLVNLLSVSESGGVKNIIDAPRSHDANGKTDVAIPKDLRHHQGLHTGHRLCCFTQCEDDVWRLQRVVAHSRGGYACNICGKKFKRRKILRRHERFHTGEKPYSCSHCSKTFALRKSLRRHERFHTGERPHGCPQCGKSFRLRDNLKAHLRFHTGEKPFICTECGKSFRIFRNLEKHNLSQCGLIVPSFRKIAGL